MVKLVMEKDHMEKLYNSKNPLVGYVHNKRISEIIKLIPKKKGLKILDAGCGEGQLFDRIPKDLKAELYGADLTKVAIESAKERTKGAKFSIQDLTDLNYKDGFFDVVICTEVIEHIPEYKKALLEFKRVLKKGGILILSFPNEPLCMFTRFIFLRNPRIKDHVNSFSPRRMIKEVNLNALKVVNLPWNIPNLLSLVHIISLRK